MRVWANVPSGVRCCKSPRTPVRLCSFIIPSFVVPNRNSPEASVIDMGTCADQVIRLSDTRHWLILAAHHSPTDQMSIGIMLRDLAAFYNSIVCNSRVDLPVLQIQAADHMAWVVEQERQGCFAEDQSWWRKRFQSPESGDGQAFHLNPYNNQTGSTAD